MPRKRRIPLIGPRRKTKKPKSVFPGLVSKRTRMPDSTMTLEMICDSENDCEEECEESVQDEACFDACEAESEQKSIQESFFDHTYALPSDFLPSVIEANFCTYNFYNVLMHEKDNRVSYEEDDEIYSSIEVGENITVETDSFFELYNHLLEKIETPFLITKDEKIKIFEMYESTVKSCVLIDSNFTVKLLVHNRLVPKTHKIFEGLFKVHMQASDVLTLLTRMKTYHVCLGNPEPELVKSVPEEVEYSIDDPIGFRESDFGARRGTFTYTTTIRTTACSLLTMKDRCASCSKFRGVLRNRKLRRIERELKLGSRKYVHSNMAHKNMDRNQLIVKINQQGKEIRSLTTAHEYLKKKQKLDEYISRMADTA